MGIAEVYESYDGGRSGAIDENFQGTYTRNFEVQTDDPLTGIIAVRNAPGIAIGTPYSIGTIGASYYEEDPGAFAKSIRAQQDGKEPTKWQVSIEYGPWQSREANPLEEAPKVSYGFAQFQMVVWRDKDGLAMLNSAGDPIDPPVVRDESRMVINITRNEATYDPDLADTLKDVVNDGVWRGRPARTWKAAAPTGDPANHPACGDYYVVKYQFAYNPDTWDWYQLDQGYREVVSGARKLIMLDNAPASSPVPLNGSGGKLAVGGTPVFRQFKLYKEIDFSVFDLEPTP